MNQGTQVKIETNKRFQHASSADAAERIVAGVIRVKRESNAKRQFGVTFAHLGKLNPIFDLHLRDLICCFGDLIGNAVSCCHPTVLGLAESGIVPSFAMHRACLELGILSRWCCTTRASSPNCDRFAEPHSHAPHHFVPANLLDKHLEELWIVDDEITTGATLNNLLECLLANRKLERVRIFSLLDTRDSASVISFDNYWQRKGVAVTVESVMTVSSCFWQQDWDVVHRMPANHPPRTYFTGESIVHGLPLLLSGELQALQQITLSPWTVDGVNILSRQEKSTGYYLYNAGEAADA